MSELTSSSSGSYTYDANGNTLSDPSGKSYSWDFENRLTQAVVPGANGGTASFKYDPFGRKNLQIIPELRLASLSTMAAVWSGRSMHRAVRLRATRKGRESINLWRNSGAARRTTTRRTVWGPSRR